jgi:hypothetical protein
MAPDRRIALAVLAVALEPERQAVTSVAARLGWTLAQLGQVVQTQASALAVVGIQLHAATVRTSPASSIIVDGQRYDGISWPELRTSYPRAANLTRALALVEHWVGHLDATGLAVPDPQVMRLRAAVIWAATLGGAPSLQPGMVEDPRTAVAPTTYEPPRRMNDETEERGTGDDGRWWSTSADTGGALLPTLVEHFCRHSVEHLRAAIDKWRAGLAGEGSTRERRCPAPPLLSGRRQ